MRAAGRTLTTWRVTKEVLGGIVLIEAREINEAVQIAGGFPHATLGAVEVRPLVDCSKPRPKL